MNGAFAYDGDGNRVSQTVNGATTAYVNDTNRALPVILTEGTTKDVWGPAGLAERVDAAGTVQVPLTDGLGSVRAITDGADNVVQTMLTDAFGNPANPAGSQGTASQPFGFTGQPTDPLGLVDLRARVYAPSLGRFLQRDPLAGNAADPLSLNRSTYARNNPTSLTDPSGLTPSNKVLQGGDDTCNNPLSALYCGIVNPILGPGGLLSMLPGIFHGQGDGGGGGDEGAGQAGTIVVLSGANPSDEELWAAQLLAVEGYAVEFKPPVGIRSPFGGTADAYVNGEVYDIYSPKTSNIGRIVSAVAKKGNQTPNVVLDLTQTGLTRADLPSNFVNRVRGTGSRIQNVIIVGG